ncbi:MAG: hypothetical protein WBY71_04710, partial [Nitrososphaeraceae archaeon]
LTHNLNSLENMNYSITYTSLVMISELAPSVMSPFTMGQTIWFRCIHIHVEIVVANCTTIEAKFSGRLLA